MNCPRCQSSNRPGAESCRRCADPLPRSCAGCGSPLREAGELCGSCRTERIPAALGAELMEELPAADIITDEAQALVPGGSRHFIGRAAILKRLVERATRAGPPALGFVAVLGPAGIGKTRLGAELARQLLALDAGVRVLSTYCGGPGSSPYAAVRRMLRARFAIEDADGDSVARDKISRGVEATVARARSLEVTHLVAQLVGVPFPDSPVVTPLADSPAQLEARTFIALRRLFTAEASRGKLVVIVDDVERASTETVNLLHYLAAGMAEQPVLIVCLARPELFEVHPTFGEGDLVLERIELGPLSSDEAVALFTELAATSPLPAELVAHVRDKLSATPRALESLVAQLREAGALVHGDAGWRVDTDRLRGLNLARDLEGVVGERLRAMPDSERDLLEKAAACGEAFWLDAVVALVRAVALERGDPDGPTLGEVAAAGDRTRAEVATALQALVQRGLLIETAERHSTIAGEREFRFAAPPWWEVVYEGIDDERRRRYHRLTAQWLELRPHGRGEEEQEDIARHLERAGDGEGAALRYRRAGDAARGRYFNDKAIRLYVAALGCLGKHDLASRIHLWHDLGSVFQLKGDFDSALGAFERMLRLSWVVASRTKAAVAFNKMGRIYRQKSELALALEYLERGHELFEQSSDTRGVAGSLDDIGQVLWMMSRYDEALDRSAAALEMRRRIGDKRAVAASLMHIGNIERHRGLFDEAHACYEEAGELRTALADAAGIIEVNNGLGMLAFHRGDLDGAHRFWDAALRRAEEIGAAPLEALLLNHLGEIARALGQRGEARTRFEAARALATELDDRRLLCESLYNLGLVELADGHAHEALGRCSEALQLAEQAGIRVDVGRALLALGEVHASTLFDDTGHGTRLADDFFRRGVALFREIGNEAELAQGLYRYGQYRLERGETGEGRALLGEAETIFARIGMHASRRERRLIGELEAG